MTALYRRWTTLFHVLCGVLLLPVVACKVPLVKPPLPPAICDSSQENGVSIQTSSATASVGASQYTATFKRSLALSPSGTTGTGGGGETHLLLQRTTPANGSTPASTATSLQMDTQLSPTGALQLSVVFGDGFQGIKEILFTSADRVTIRGAIDGRAIAPFPIKGDAKSMKFADGSAIPSTTVDPNVSQALPLLTQAIQTQCDKTNTPGTPAPSAALAPVGAASPSGDPPAHSFTPSLFCDICAGAATAAYDYCSYLAAGASVACGLAYPICFGLAEAACAATWAVALGTLCHVPGFAQTFGQNPGPPCCPLFCGGSACCNAGEVCAAQGLCCSAGQTACGVNCCVGGQTCLANGTCCTSANACNGQSCCNTGDTCMANGSCCPAGLAVCNGVCCSDPHDICDPATNACKPACPSGTQTCGETCCAGGQTCIANGTCCATSSVCTGANGTSCCGAGQLCCLGNGPAGNRQCVTPVEAYPWCGQLQPTLIDCSVAPASVCKPGSICTAKCSGSLCSDEQFCTPP
jgi:lipoprotein-anchoring transpeptidase ErfK/SrfK